VRVAIVAGPNPASAFPAAALALSLTDNGDDVLVLTGRRWLERLHQLGVSAEELPEHGDAAGPAVEPRYGGPAQAVAVGPATRDLLAEFGPDLVVADVRTLAGGFAAEMLGVPWAQLHPRLISFSADPGMLKSHSGRGASLRGRRSRRSQQLQRDLSAAREELGLPAVGPGPALHMVATLPGLEPPRPDWPRNASVVGPLTWDPAVEDLDIPEGQSPLVMVSPSTSATGRKSLLDVTLNGLRGMRMVGTQLEPYDQPVPWWASVGIGRQEPLLAHADVVVTGGGHGMIVRALIAGVPLVLAPAAGDVELARRAEQLGAALVLRRADPRSLRRAVERVIEDRAYSSAARQIARTVATADPVVLCHQTLVGRSMA